MLFIVHIKFNVKIMTYPQQCSKHLYKTNVYFIILYCKKLNFYII